MWKIWNCNNLHKEWNNNICISKVCHFHKTNSDTNKIYFLIARVFGYQGDNSVRDDHAWDEMISVKTTKKNQGKHSFKMVIT